LKDRKKLKAQIYRHRSYRILRKSTKWQVFLELLIAFLIFDVVLLLFYPHITLFMNKVAAVVLSPVYQSIKLVTEDFIFGNVYLLDLSGKYPSISFSIIVAIISLITIIVMAIQRFIIKSFSIWLIFISIITLISALFFIFFAKYFPYSMRIFLDLYVKTIICIWLVIPVIIIFAVAPFPVNYLYKLFVILMVLIWSIIFGILRYIVFILILRKLSYIFMADLYFIFGPFLDFIYIVGVYSLIISKLARKLKGDEDKWQWLF